MNTKTHILLIEHEPARIDYKYVIEKAGAIVTLVEEYNENTIEEILKANTFDFIITDAYFLPKDQKHSNQTIDDVYRLPEIIRLVRKFDKRVVLIVYSSYNDKLCIEDLTEVDYVFDKDFIRADMFEWQLKRFIQTDPFSSYYEHAIVKELLSFTNSNNTLIWRDYIEKMLKDYRNGINESDQFVEVLDSFKNIFLKLNEPAKYINLFEKAKDFELFNLANSPNKFGHLRHVINVYWLGYYIINGLLKEKDIWGGINIEEINKTWLVTALFHDIGHFGESYDETKIKIYSLLSLYPVKYEANKNDFSKSQFSLDEETIDAFRSLVAGGDKYLQTIIKDNMKMGCMDHGVLSALTIYEQLFNTIESKTDKTALQAISLHNLFEKNIALLDNYSFDKYPILNLLILCDHIETWDRESGFAIKLEDRNKIERIELVEIGKDGNKLYLKINYQMYRSFIPAYENEAKILLKDLLIKKVYPLFERMKFNSIFELDIEYLLNYRNQLLHFPNT